MNGSDGERPAIAIGGLADHGIDMDVLGAPALAPALTMAAYPRWESPVSATVSRNLDVRPAWCTEFGTNPRHFSDVAWIEAGQPGSPGPVRLILRAEAGQAISVQVCFVRERLGVGRPHPDEGTRAR